MGLIGDESKHGHGPFAGPNILFPTQIVTGVRLS